MKKKMKILLLLLSISVTLGLMSNTYSRYVADTTGNVELSLAKWQILINDNDITNNTTSTINITPILENNENIKENTIAPTSKGYFDINIDPTNVGISFLYTIDLKVLNENFPDLLITKYAIINDNNEENPEISTTNITENKITNALYFDNENTAYTFNPFTIRVYFEWFEGETEQMNDEADTKVGIEAAQNDTNLQIQASISFEQII